MEGKGKKRKEGSFYDLKEKRMYSYRQRHGVPEVLFITNAEMESASDKENAAKLRDVI